jgi:beta-lactamase class A
MTSLWKGAGLALALAGLTQVGAAAIKSADVARPAKAAAKTEKKAAKAPAKLVRTVPAPKTLANRIDALGKAFNGQVGIAVKSVDAGWETGWKDHELYPQQSVSKLWVAITALDAADRGKVSMDDKVTLTRKDLTVFHQPIRDEILKDGSYTTTLDDLMVRQITTSDNTANDKLMRSVGGYKAVRAMIVRKHLGAIRFSEGERAMQSKIAGMAWSPAFSIGDAFWTAREKVPIKKRSAAFAHYIADPYDGAAPSAVVSALARLKKGDLLSPKSTARLLDIMGNTHTGPNRLRGGLEPGWTASHKTGTGQVLGGVQAGYNEVAVLTAPDGRSYAVAVMIKKTSTPLTVRMNLMHEVVEAVIRQHDSAKGKDYAL